MIKKISQLNRLPEEFRNEEFFNEDPTTLLRKKNEMLFEVSYETADTSNQTSADEVNYYTSYSTTLSDLGDMLGTNEMRQLLSTITEGGISVITVDLEIGPEGTTSQFDRLSGHSYRPNNNQVNIYSSTNFENDVTVHGKAKFHNNVVLKCNDADVSNPDNPILKVEGVAVFDQTIKGTAYRAQWADLAEIYAADEKYEPGTLIKFGGDKEITIAKDRANGVVTSNPAIVLNDKDGETMEFPTGVALVGRVPLKVRGPVRKFDRIVLSKVDPGIGVVYNYSSPNEIIGRALEENFNPGEKLVMCATRMNLT